MNDMSKKKSEIDNTNDSIKEFVDSLLPVIKEVQRLQKQQLKQLKPIVHDAITSKVQDEKYLCRLADSLSEMVNFAGIGDKLYNELLDYISTFNPETAKWYRESDKEMNGIYDPVIEVASEMAMNFHTGQKDKAGIDYFEGHLTFVGNAGNNWKEKIAGFLHDVAEDTPHTVEEIMQILKVRSNGVLSEEDAREIETALNLLNSTTATSREEYIARIKNSSLATRVKLNDLKHNMDISRIPNQTQKDLDRLARYEKEYRQILGYLEPSDMTIKKVLKNE
jgi:hypothetical protein